MVEFHKRWDPMYVDARERIRQLGDCGFFHSYMSQPKIQLNTFRQWAGRSSDISYYLNSHHIDFHAWALQGTPPRSRPPPPRRTFPSPSRHFASSTACTAGR